MKRIYASLPKSHSYHIVVNNPTYGYQTCCGITGTPAPLFFDDTMFNRGDFEGYPVFFWEGMLLLCGKCRQCDMEKHENPVLTAEQLNLMYIRDDWEDYPEIYQDFNPLILEKFFHEHRRIFTSNSRQIFKLARAVVSMGKLPVELD